MPFCAALERVRGELEGGPRVVVETPYQAMVDDVGHAERLETGAHPGEVGPARVTEVVQEMWRVLGGRAALRGLAVEHAQRVLSVA